ncbi:MAG: hydroxysqualene dehydroxylase HpnE [Pseudomonadota bacterium]
MNTTVHVVGLGLSGLAAAVYLARAGINLRLYEGAGHAGGRCRSFDDKALGVEIDNGNHLLLSGNLRAFAYLDAIGARDEVKIFDRAAFPFVDLRSGERWCIDLGEGRTPRWLLDRNRRVKGASVPAHLGAIRILLAGRDTTVCDAVSSGGILFERFWEPMSMAVLNTRPERGSAALLRRVLLETFGRGGQFARPVIAKRGLSQAFVRPALAFLERAGAMVQLRTPLKDLDVGSERVARLRFENHSEEIHERDMVVLALPPSRLGPFLPGVELPDDEAVIANAHFRVPALDGDERIEFVGLTNATTHWVFRRKGVISTTISAAHELGLERLSSENLLSAIWSEVRSALSLPVGLEPQAQRLIKEKRATFDQSPAGVLRRPATTTNLRNLFLAGDVVDNGLPATIEGAIRNGEEAARQCLSRIRPDGSVDKGTVAEYA